MWWEGVEEGRPSFPVQRLGLEAASLRSLAPVSTPEGGTAVGQKGFGGARI